MQTLRLSLAWAMLLSLGAAEKTLVFYREGGGDGAFVRERNGDWRWWSGVERKRAVARPPAEPTSGGWAPTPPCPAPPFRFVSLLRTVFKKKFFYFN